MSEEPQDQRGPVVNALLCVGADVISRFGDVLRHLLVGLVDQAIPLRVVSSSARIEQLSLAPVPTLTHPPMIWPLGSRRLRRLIGQVDAPTPTVILAAGRESYSIAATLAQTFDADLAIQVTSGADAEAVGSIENPRVDRILVSSRLLQTWVEHRWKAPAERLLLVRPGLPASARIACFAHPQRTPTLVCTSALDRGAGTAELIDAVDLLRQRGHELMMFLMGSGSGESPLRRRVRERRLSSHISFVDPLNDLAPVLQYADLFIRPAAENAFTADALQAMGAGCAVVAVPDEVNDHFLDQETCMICECNDAKTLADAIDRLLSDRTAAQALATRAMEYVRANHAMSTMAERTASVIRELALSQSTLSMPGPSTLA